MSASARTWLGPVSPRRIARRVIGKKAGFPIGFIRLTSVDSVAPTMARTNGARVVRCVACSWNERIPLRVESIAGNYRWQRYELDRRERENSPIQFAFVGIWLKLKMIEFDSSSFSSSIFFDTKYIYSYNHNIVTNINYGLISKNSTETKKKYEWNNNIHDALACAETINGWYQDSFDMLILRFHFQELMEIVTDI